MPLLELDNVHVHYGAVHALKGISFRVEAGEVVCILGANGAGKSTILRTISALERPSEGHIAFDGNDITREPAHRIVERGITHCPEGRRIFPDCTVAENLMLGGYTLADDAERREHLDRVLENFPRLAERRRQMGATLSGGEQQMLGVARALMSRPRLLLLDEPSLGLAPRIVEQVFDIVRRINADGVTILLVEQNANEALHHSDRGYVLETGSIGLEGASEELLHNPRVVEAYLGV